MSVSTIHGDLLWCDGGWPGSCHEHALLELSGGRGVLDATQVAALVDRGFRGLARDREHWHAPFGDRPTNDTLTAPQRDHNRLQAALRALVEQSVSHSPTPGRCAAGVGWCTASATSTAPPPH